VEEEEDLYRCSGAQTSLFEERETERGEVEDQADE